MNFHLEYFQKQEENRMARQQANQIHLLNSNICRLIQSIDSDVEERDDVFQKEDELSRYLTQTSIRKVGWLNNLERIETAYLQIEWLCFLIQEKGFVSGFDRIEEVKYEMNGFYHQAQHIDTRDVRNLRVVYSDVFR